MLKKFIIIKNARMETNIVCFYLFNRVKIIEKELIQNLVYFGVTLAPPPNF